MRDNFSDLERIFTKVTLTACNRPWLRKCLYIEIVGKVSYHTQYSVPQHPAVAGQKNHLKIDHIFAYISGRCSCTDRWLYSNCRSFSPRHSYPFSTFWISFFPSYYQKTVFRTLWHQLTFEPISSKFEKNKKNWKTRIP